MRRHASALLGAVVASLLLGGCGAEARALDVAVPERYATVEQLVADADAVALVQADRADVEVVDRVPYTRTEVRLRKVLLGEVDEEAVTVSQMGSPVRPPAPGMAGLLRSGQEYVVVLHRTGPAEFEVVGPGVWKADTLGASLTLHTAAAGSVPAAIPHETTPWDLEVELGEVGDVLGTSVIGRA